MQPSQSPTPHPPRLALPDEVALPNILAVLFRWEAEVPGSTIGETADGEGCLELVGCHKNTQVRSDVQKTVQTHISSEFASIGGIRIGLD